MLRGLLFAKAGLVRHSLFLFHRCLIPLSLGLVMGYLWLESNFVVRDHRCQCLSPLASIVLDLLDLNVILLITKTQHQVVAPRNAMIPEACKRTVKNESRTIISVLFINII